MMIDESIFKAYDIRGIYPESINDDISYAVGQGYAELVKPRGPIAIGCDVRLHSEEIKKAVIEGLLDAGVDVVDVGLISTEMIYFAVGKYDYAGGIQITASHNSKEWHGIKMIGKNVLSISSDNGILEIKDFVCSLKKINKNRGSRSERNILKDFAKYMLDWRDGFEIQPLKIVADSNNGYQNIVLSEILKLDKFNKLEVVAINDQPDGNFPNGKPDPLIPENRAEIIQRVKNENADFGVIWDADGDRVFFIDENGTFLEPYYVGVILAENMLKKFPKSKVIHDPRYTWALIDMISSFDGEAILERAGHSFIKTKMRKENALFSCEWTGHTYYRDFWFADSGIIPLLQIIKILSEKRNKLSELITPLREKYPISGEINFSTHNGEQIIKKVRNKYKDSKTNDMDGISCEYSDWRFNLRSSNTSLPKLRLNLEAKTERLVKEKTAEISSFIKKNL